MERQAFSSTHRNIEKGHSATGVVSNNLLSFSNSRQHQERHDLISNTFRELELRSMKGANCNVGFMLVGHGVPYQLLQDHVDCAWKMLNEIPSSTKNVRTAGNTMVDDNGEVVECIFYNDSKRLHFDG